ncbi:MAG: peptide chain release factor N(5)-glutamine methyltransferase [Holosporales bacterium]|jgi:release factor glutamine methyltransferase|nr:peptide chain release factor N(5)-glutamine methyltransferase [Holosporales bacterium]
MQQNIKEEDSLTLLVKRIIEIFSLEFNVNKKEVALLLAHIAGLSYTELFFMEYIKISDNKFISFINGLHRLEAKEPLSKILQKKEFYDIEFDTTRDTLDPRPETELIIDLFKKYYGDISTELRILDLGCGTGCIGLTILNLYKNALCLFVDISQGALNVAETNSQKLDLRGRSLFQISDWFTDVSGQFDAIVSNPPYIAKGCKVSKSVLYDPKVALFAGKDGMDAYKKIIPEANEFLKQNGLLFIEIGLGQKSRVTDFNSKLSVLEVAKDLSGVDRTIVFKNG